MVYSLIERGQPHLSPAGPAEGRADRPVLGVRSGRASSSPTRCRKPLAKPAMASWRQPLPQSPPAHSDLSCLSTHQKMSAKAELPPTASRLGSDEAQHTQHQPCLHRASLY